ncbi:hypothetical protein DY000_02016854 [Brassica cretica]|uniref:Uncharacterized protein n=1 Tax=Brassica cretica TaxID=69181 RepID=A0ABQ7D7V1_BRACR|nr:hypothetical protein DY000_02016854 [Brassica cretica]
MKRSVTGESRRPAVFPRRVTVASGGESRHSGGIPAVVWRRRKAVNATATTFGAVRKTHARAEAKLPEALAASSGLRLRRGWWLRLRIDKGNMMVALHARDPQRLERYGRFTERPKTKLKRVPVSGDSQAWRSLGVRWFRRSLVAPLQRFPIFSCS